MALNNDFHVRTSRTDMYCLSWIGRVCAQCCVKKVSEGPYGLSRENCYDLLRMLSRRRKWQCWHAMVGIWTISWLVDTYLTMFSLLFFIYGTVSDIFSKWSYWEEYISASFLLLLWYLLITDSRDWRRVWLNKSKTSSSWDFRETFLACSLHLIFLVGGAVNYNFPGG